MGRLSAKTVTEASRIGGGNKQPPMAMHRRSRHCHLKNGPSNDRDTQPENIFKNLARFFAQNAMYILDDHLRPYSASASA